MGEKKADDLTDDERCSAKSKTSGDRCGKRALFAQRVCRTHGGKAPQAINAARNRLSFAADEAARALTEMSGPVMEGEKCAMCGRGQIRDENVRTKASIAVLDRVGIGSSSKVTVEVTPDTQWLEYLEPEQAEQIFRWMEQARDRVPLDERPQEEATH